MRILKFVTTLYLASFAAASLAEIAIIVHPSNLADISSSAVERIFLGKQKAFSSGVKAVPVNLEAGTPTREQFDSVVLDKSSAQLKAHWSKLIFTGKGTQPTETSEKEMLDLVSSNPNTIGYIDSSKVTDAVMVLMTK